MYDKTHYNIVISLQLIKINEKKKVKKKNPPTNARDMGSIPDLGRYHMLQGN